MGNHHADDVDRCSDEVPGRVEYQDCDGQEIGRHKKSPKADLEADLLVVEEYFYPGVRIQSSRVVASRSHVPTLIINDVCVIKQLLRPIPHAVCAPKKEEKGNNIFLLADFVLGACASLRIPTTSNSIHSSLCNVLSAIRLSFVDIGGVRFHVFN